MIKNVLIVTRHQGAKDWFTQTGLSKIEGIEDAKIEFMAHLSPEDNAGLTPETLVVGVLPINMIFDMNKRGIRFVSLLLDMSRHVMERGHEMTCEDMMAIASLHEYIVTEK